jgi:uncharacterized protein
MHGSECNVTCRRHRKSTKALPNLPGGRIMQDEKFEWSDIKAASNIKEHAVAFETARRAFADPFMVDLIDERFDYDEDRYWLLGEVDGRLLSVGYTIREGRIRIITARAAEPHERRRYHNENRH